MWFNPFPIKSTWSLLMSWHLFGARTSATIMMMLADSCISRVPLTSLKTDCAFDSLTFDTFTFVIKPSALTFQSQHGTMIYHIIEVHYTYLAPYTGCHFLLSIPDTITVYNTIIWPNTVWHPGAGLGYLIPRLLHSLSLVALGLLVGYETWSPIGCHHPFVINWSKYRLGLPRSQWNMSSRETGGHLNFSEAIDNPLAQPLWQATACR